MFSSRATEGGRIRREGEFGEIPRGSELIGSAGSEPLTDLSLGLIQHRGKNLPLPHRRHHPHQLVVVVVVGFP